MLLQTVTNNSLASSLLCLLCVFPFFFFINVDHAADSAIRSTSDDKEKQHSPLLSLISAYSSHFMKNSLLISFSLLVLEVKTNNEK